MMITSMPAARRSATGWIALVPQSQRSEEHTSELQSRLHLVCRLLLELTPSSDIHTLSYTTLFRSLYTTPAAHRSLSFDGHPTRFGLSSAFGVAVSPVGRW